MLNSSELAKSGISGKFVAIAEEPMENDTVKPLPGVGLVTERQLEQGQRMQEAAAQPHPLAPESHNSTEGFEVWIETRPVGSRGVYTRRAFRFQDNDCFITLSKGEEFRIVFRTPHTEDYYVRVLVDGLNTLAQRQMTVARGVFIEAIDSESEGEYVVAPRVPLEEAVAWVAPKGTVAVSRTVEGFYEVNRNANTVQRFRVVDVEDSFAARQNYTEQIGLITVAFCKAVLPGTRGSGIGGGPRREANIQQIDMGGRVPGDMVAVYNIRYEAPEATNRALPSQRASEQEQRTVQPQQRATTRSGLFGR